MNARIEKYLVAYNYIQLFGWICVLAALIFSQTKLFYILCFVQTFALLEIVHTLFKWIKSNFIFTFLQIGARVLMLVIVSHLHIEKGFLNDSLLNPFTIFKIMTLAWCIAEIIRSSYYLKRQSNLITWSRYNAFIICYPIGVTSELYLIYSLAINKSKLSVTIALILLTIAYFIVFPSLYLHLLKQRKLKV
ncbi:MAG TPA: protein tyrosine phosphatase-like domain-containing protein [Chitinophagales bacterium]|nr:protein tyrosine phosphatase-like domain-containing protein [Chitinophagales bacterium]